MPILTILEEQKENKSKSTSTSKWKSKDGMAQMLSSYYRSLRHEEVKQADQICKNSDLTCRRADI